MSPARIHAACRQTAWALACVVLLSLLLGSRARARDVAGGDGPALGVALGADGGGLGGGFVAYYLTWPSKRLGLMPHAGLGAAFDRQAAPAFSVGVAGSYGRRHRLVIDLQWTGVGTQKLTLYGANLDAETVYGLCLLFGWEWLTRSGFFMRANVGPAFAFLPPLYQRSEALFFSANLLAMGVKAW